MMTNSYEERETVNTKACNLMIKIQEKIVKTQREIIKNHYDNLGPEARARADKILAGP